MPRTFFLALALLSCSMLAKANITISGSRVIYDQARSEVDIHLQQVGKVPGITQIWLDNGNEQTRADRLDPPFLLAPAIARIDPGQRQIVRIIHSRDDLPSDRESLLWLNVLETPLSGSGHWPGVRTRIKFFYRPDGLTSDPELAYQALRFALESAPADGAVKLRVTNPTPYHITLREVTLRHAADAPALAEFGLDSLGERMIAPMDELVLTLARATSTPLALTRGVLVIFSIINDSGGASTGEQPLSPWMHTGMAAR